MDSQPNGHACCAQVLRFDVTAAAPDPTAFTLASAIDGIQFEPATVRIVSADTAMTTLLVGGLDGNDSAPYQGVVALVSIAAGSSNFTVEGSVVLPSFAGSGVTALSQTSSLHRGFVLASTDSGVFKCARLPLVTLLPARAGPSALQQPSAGRFRAHIRLLCSVSHPVGVLTTPPPGSAVTSAICNGGMQSAVCYQACIHPKHLSRTAHFCCAAGLQGSAGSMLV